MVMVDVVGVVSCGMVSNENVEMTLEEVAFDIFGDDGTPPLLIDQRLFSTKHNSWKTPGLWARRIHATRVTLHK